MDNGDNHTSDEFKLFSLTAQIIRKEFQEENSNWNNSPFKWVLNLPAGSKGKLGKRLVFQWCALKGLSVDRCLDSEADIQINGHRAEVKFSTLWKEGFYRFQQIRNQNYEYSICLGISPFDVHCWVISKPILLKHVIGHLGQHTGLKGKETAWFPVYPDNPPEWLISCGGTLEHAYQVLYNLSYKR